MTIFWQICCRCRKSRPFSLSGRCCCGGSLLVEYDLDAVKSKLTKENLKHRPPTMWRYRELLPITDPASIVSLGEGFTPLVPLHALEKLLNVRSLLVKREEQNPTGSFKARGFSSTVSLLKEHGVHSIAVPSNGNAAAALAAYAAYAGMEAVVLLPKDCPGVIVEECIRYGADVYLVDGLIHDAGAIVEEGKAYEGWFHAGTLREPGRVEGKKTMGLELAEQLEWQLPDAIIYPTGGGSGIIGLWKAFQELRQLGMVSGPLPRLISVQEAGCQPVADCVHGEPRGNAPSNDVTTSPTGLRVPNPPDPDLVVSIIQASNGTAVSVTKEQIDEAQRTMGRCGISSSPEGAATVAGLLQLRETGRISSLESIVLLNTSSAEKYVNWRSTEQLPIIRSYAEMAAVRKMRRREIAK